MTSRYGKANKYGIRFRRRRKILQERGFGRERGAAWFVKEDSCCPDSTGNKVNEGWGAFR
jgi:hypothetical protein